MKEKLRYATLRHATPRSVKMNWTEPSWNEMDFPSMKWKRDEFWHMWSNLKYHEMRNKSGNIEAEMDKWKTDFENEKDWNRWIDELSIMDYNYHKFYLRFISWILMSKEFQYLPRTDEIRIRSNNMCIAMINWRPSRSITKKLSGDTKQCIPWFDNIYEHQHDLSKMNLITFFNIVSILISIWKYCDTQNSKIIGIHHCCHLFEFCNLDCQSLLKFFVLRNCQYENIELRNYQNQRLQGWKFGI
jgi:hypothetical protein